MSEKKSSVKIPSSELFPIIEEHLLCGQEIVIQVRGNSMFPLMRSNIDTVKLAAAKFETIKVCDVVLIRRENGAYVIHRVCKKTRTAFFMVGDNQNQIEGPLCPNQLIAVTVEVYRGKRTIRRGSALWNVYAWIWLILRPVRMPLLKILVKLHNKAKRKP